MSFSADARGDNVVDVQYCQLYRLRCTLNDDSVVILVYAFVSSRAAKMLTDKLQRVMNAVARVDSNIWKFDRVLSQLRYDVLHCLDVTDRITFRLCVHVFLCLHDMIPTYLTELCRMVSEFEGCRHLLTSGRCQLDIARYHLAG